MKEQVKQSQAGSESVTDIYPNLSSKLSERKKNNLFRQLNSVSGKPTAATLISDGKEYINFSSNDYLGLSSHPDLISKSIEFTQKYGTGSSSSRLITGTLSIHTQLEEEIADLYNREKSLLFNTGFQANCTILPAITSKGDLIIADKNCHNSILTGCLASAANFQRFRHNDLDHLESLLINAREKKVKNVWIVSESLFSMDGDKAPIQDLIALSNKYNSRLYIDDAHAFGIYGSTGLGLVEDLPQIDIIVSTFGKAGGSFGAFAAGNTVIIDSLINFSNGFIYTTALPPSIIGSIKAALNLIPKMKSERKNLFELSRSLKSELIKSGFKTGKSNSHIIPVILGSDEKANKISNQLLDSNIMAVSVRPPTVAKGKSRIRLSLTSDHNTEHVKQLLDSLNAC